MLASVRDESKRFRSQPWDPYPFEICRGLSEGQIHPGLSLWVAVTAEAGGRADPPFDPVYLRTTHRRDGAGGRGDSRMLGLSFPGGLVNFQLVFHPLHDLVHPFESDGTVRRVWPNPPAHLDLKTLPRLRGDSRLGSVFLESGLAVVACPR